MLRDELTPLEMERLGLLCLGLDYRAIGFLTGLNVYTTRLAFRKMFQKTGTSDGLELAVRFAREVFMGYDEGGAVPAPFPKRDTVDGSGGFESRRRLITPVIFPANASTNTLRAEGVCEL